MGKALWPWSAVLSVILQLTISHGTKKERTQEGMPKCRRVRCSQSLQTNLASITASQRMKSMKESRSLSHCLLVVSFLVLFSPALSNNARSPASTLKLSLSLQHRRLYKVLHYFFGHSSCYCYHFLCPQVEYKIFSENILLKLLPSIIGFVLFSHFSRHKNNFQRKKSCFACPVMNCWCKIFSVLEQIWAKLYILSMRMCTLI